MADKNRIYNFSTDSYWQARLRQGNCCANCSDDLGDLPRTEAPGHHSGITKQEAAAFGLENNPDWVRSSENCVVYCRECHAAFAHDGGRFRDRVELPDNAILHKESPGQSRMLAMRQEIAYLNAEAAFTGQTESHSDPSNGVNAMPSFEDRKRDPSHDNLFGADAGPKGEQGPANLAGGGHGDENTNKQNQDLGQLQTPKEFSQWSLQQSVQQGKETTSHADYMKALEKDKEQQNEQSQKNEQEQVRKQELQHKY